jgi:hypothetical protein
VRAVCAVVYAGRVQTKDLTFEQINRIGNTVVECHAKVLAIVNRMREVGIPENDRVYLALTASLSPMRRSITALREEQVKGLSRRREEERARAKRCN